MTVADYIVNSYIDSSSQFSPVPWADPDVGARMFHSKFAELFNHARAHIFMLKMNHVQPKAYLEIRTSNFNAPIVPKHEKERVGVQG